MTSRLKRKLQSNRGASITFALLLFLVCAVVGSVVLTAGTAAAGRMSQMAEMDQRYYAVTSAAELLKDEIDGQTAVVKKSVVTTSTASYDSSNTYKGSASSSSGTTSFTYSVIDKNGVTSDKQESDLKTSLILNATKYLGGSETSKKYSLSSVSDAGTPDPLAVNIDEKISPEGTLKFTVYNGDGDSNSYKLMLVFEADMKTNVTNNSTNGPKEISSTEGTAYTITTTTTTTTTTSVKWTLASIGTIY